MAYDKEMPKEVFQFNSRSAFGYKPVYWDSEKNDWQVVDSEHPMPSGDAQVKSELELVKAELQAVKAALQGTLNTQLTGSYIEEEPLPDATILAGASLEVKKFNRDVDKLVNVEKVNLTGLASINHDIAIFYRAYIDEVNGVSTSDFKQILNTKTLIIKGQPTTLETARGAIRVENKSTTDVSYSKLKLIKFLRRE